MKAASPGTRAMGRFLIEVAPLGLLVESARGHSNDGWQSVLDKVVTGTGDRPNRPLALRRRLSDLRRDLRIYWEYLQP